jgi:hypothetical protein
MIWKLERLVTEFVRGKHVDSAHSRMKVLDPFTGPAHVPLVVPPLRSSFAVSLSGGVL